MTIASDYYEARYCEAAFAAAGFAKVVMTVLLSLGVSCKLTSDIQVIADRLQYNMDSWASESEQAMIQDFISTGKVNVSDVSVAKLWAKLKAKVKNIISDKDKSVTKPKVPEIMDTTASLQLHQSVLSNSDLKSVWNNIPVTSGTVDFASEVTKNGFCLVGKQLNLEHGTMQFRVIYPFRSMLDKSGYGNYYLQYDGTSFEMCTKSSGAVISGSQLLKHIVLDKKTADADCLSVTHGTIRTPPDGVDYWYGDNYTGYSNVSITLGEVISRFDDTWSFCMYSALPVYDSYQDYVQTNTVATAFPLGDSIYGDGEAGIDDTKDFTLTDEAISDAVEDALEDYIRDHPDATDEELNDVVGAIIPGIADIDDKLDDTNDEISVSNNWLQTIYNKINSRLDVNLSSIATGVEDLADEKVISNVKQISSIAVAVEALPSLLPNMIFDGILAIWNSHEQKQFREQLFAYLNAIKSDISYIRLTWEKWIEGTYNNTLAISQKDFSPDVTVAPGEAVDLNGISSSLDSVKNTVGSVSEKIDNLTNIVSSLPGKVDGITGAVTSLPDRLLEPVVNVTATVPDVIVPEIKVPDVIVPEIEVPEIIVPKAQVVEVVHEVFVIDTERVHTDADRLLKSYNSFFPDLKILLGIVLLFSFPSEVEYPEIKFETPEILKPYVDSNYIVLINFAEYSVYCSWTRNIVRAIIWISFIYTIFGHFKVKFSVT